MSLRRAATLTDAKLKANRRNAARSTGPRSEAGKRNSCLNALKHGAWATAGCYSPEAMRALGEDPEEYQQLLARLRRAQGPTDPLWEEQVEDLARLYWRRKRLERTASVLISRRMQEAESEAGAEASEEARAERAQEEALLLPLAPEGMELGRQMEAVERAIDRKTWLLLRLREEAERRERQRAYTAQQAKAEEARTEQTEPSVSRATLEYIEALEEALSVATRSKATKNGETTQNVIENTDEVSGGNGPASGEEEQETEAVRRDE